MESLRESGDLSFEFRAVFALGGEEVLVRVQGLGEEVAEAVEFGFAVAFM